MSFPPFRIFKTTKYLFFVVVSIITINVFTGSDVKPVETKQKKNTTNFVEGSQNSYNKSHNFTNVSFLSGKILTPAKSLEGKLKQMMHSQAPNKTIAISPTLTPTKSFEKELQELIQTINKTIVITPSKAVTKTPEKEPPQTTTRIQIQISITSSKKLHTKEELQAMTYNYLKNVSEIHMQNYLQYINDTLKTFAFPSEFNIKNVQRTWPALIPKTLQVPLTNLTWQGFQLPLLTGHATGRLGNVLGEYATLFALGRVYNVTVLLHPDMKRVLKKDFPFLTMKDLPDSAPEAQWINLHRQERDYNYNSLELAAAGLFGPRPFIIHEYPFEIHLFDSIRKEITKEFRFSDELMNQARKFLLEVEIEVKKKTVKKKTKMSEITYVGFHIRRTDYIQHMIYFQGEIPNEKFLQRSLQYYRQKYTSPVFIVASDDKKFVEMNLIGPDIYIVPGTNPASDMAILTSCNHSIFTVGSFGFWTAYLTGGEVVYPDVHTNLSYCFSKKNYEATKLTSFIPLNAY